MTQTPDGVQVTFEGGAERSFDLVIGADGLHSGVRRLTFGPESPSVSYLGYYLAGWEVTNYLGLGPGSLLYNLPGELASAGGDHRAAFPRYEQAVRGYAHATQKGGDRAGRFLAPRTALGMQLRNRLLGNRLLLNLMLKAGQQVSGKITLKDYPG
jgi:2-polyprenyl-6-methoxyphenol hydroxylase-like FAD-dependent oxidoreductase